MVPGPLLAQNPAPNPNVAGQILKWSGTVEFSSGDAGIWRPAYTNAPLAYNDRVRTAKGSRATIQLSDRTHWEMDQESLYQFPPSPEEGLAGRLLKGLFYLFHRDRPGTHSIETPVVRAGVRGTEYVIEVIENGPTTLWVLDGEVTLTNAMGVLTLRSHEAGITRPGEKPEYTAMLDAASLVQWVLYYPGVLHVEELRLGEAERAALRESIEAYRAGDLPGAAALYPQDRQPESAMDKVYRAAVLLAVGRVDESEQWLAGVGGAAVSGETVARLAAAVRGLIATVKGHPPPAVGPEGWVLASEWLSESYARQARFELPGALEAARRSVEIAPDFGYGWERVAELEFGFGRVDAARKALARASALSPRNAQAAALEGFLLAADNRIHDAMDAFDRAIALDSSLGNGWLGRGLCRIKRGDLEGGRGDLQVAAMSEPRRGVLRSYLGKAFQAVGDTDRAAQELDLAREIDPNDPTAWLYSALLKQENNRINPALRDLEQSQVLNDNRAVYRSSELLDQDKALRGANLANLYRDAGMNEVSVREAVRAVNEDYASFSSHLFLANSYNSLRDPNQVNLRYETPWLSEYLVANLLAPVGAGTLSQTVSQNEYSRLFDRNRLGVVAATEYLSRGDWTVSGAQFGVLDNFGYALDGYYRDRNGQRKNDDLDVVSLSAQVKQQITPSDGLFFQAVYYDAEGGDLAQYYDPDDANRRLRFEETQEPLLFAGYHHEWGPGSHTLALVGRMEDTLEVDNPRTSDSPGQETLIVSRSGGVINSAAPFFVDQQYRNELELYTGELQQILQRGDHTWIVGARYQEGQYDTLNVAGVNSFSFLLPPQPAVSSDFERANGYLYWHWRVVDPLLLVGGVSYDWLEYPENFRFAPVISGEQTEDQVSPKAGAIWTPFQDTTLRAGYAQSLGGVSFDQSFQLEPTQVAGFNQAWRSMIPESVAGANSAATFENWGVSLEQKMATDTYLGASFDWLESDVDRTVGAYSLTPFPPSIVPDQLEERLGFEEQSLTLTADQLLGDEWTVGVRYRLSRAQLEDEFPEIPVTVLARSDQEAILHHVNFHGLFAHPTGFFGRADANWYQQSNRGYTPDLPGDDFWQFDVYAGYRFPRRRAELRVGVLNVTDQDYRLNPLNLAPELARDRTLVLGARFYY